MLWGWGRGRWAWAAGDARAQPSQEKMEKMLAETDGTSAKRHGSTYGSAPRTLRQMRACLGGPARGVCPCAPAGSRSSCSSSRSLSATKQTMARPASRAASGPNPFNARRTPTLPMHVAGTRMANQSKLIHVNAAITCDASGAAQTLAPFHLSHAMGRGLAHATTERAANTRGAQRMGREGALTASYSGGIGTSNASGITSTTWK